MDRRNFIKLGGGTTLALAGGLLLPSFIANSKRHITILHTNDTHSQIEPFEANHSRNANKGGVAR